MMREQARGGCNHDRVMVQLLCPSCGQEYEHRELTRAEMESRAMELPEREAMSLVNANLFAPINIALAANVLSDSSTAIAIANQYAPTEQSI